MKSPVQGFHYFAYISDADIKAGEVSVHAEAIESRGLPLAGISPRIRFLKDTMVLVSAPSYTSELKWCSFEVGDVVLRAVSAGDRIEVKRTSLDQLSICVFRNEQLLVAVGGLLGTDLGHDVKVTSTARRFTDKRVEIEIHGLQCVLAARESATLGIYDIYVDFPGAWNEWGEGQGESISIAPAADCVVVNSARRSAVLMAVQPRDPLCGERIDGTMIKRRYEIG